MSGVSRSVQKQRGDRAAREMQGRGVVGLREVERREEGNEKGKGREAGTRNISSYNHHQDRRREGNNTISLANIKRNNFLGTRMSSLG